MTTKSIYQKLLEFQTNIESIKKDGKNSFFKKPDGRASSYATLPNILENVKPILNALKLVLTQPIVNGEVFSIVTCTETGESVTSSVSLPTNLNAQQIGSAITYFRRYTLTSLLSLEIDEDDDGNKASGNNQKPAQSNEKLYLNEGADLNKALAYIKGKGLEGVATIEKKYRFTDAIRQQLILASK